LHFSICDDGTVDSGFCPFSAFGCTPFFDQLARAGEKTYSGSGIHISKIWQSNLTKIEIKKGTSENEAKINLMALDV
jgi:hypothetical protein